MAETPKPAPAKPVAAAVAAPAKRKLPKGRHASAIKAARQNERHRAYNRKIKQQIKLIAKEVEEACREKDSAGAKKILSKAFSLWDKAAKSKVIHRRTADRKKARLAKKVAALTPAPKKS